MLSSPGGRQVGGTCHDWRGALLTSSERIRLNAKPHHRSAFNAQLNTLSGPELGVMLLLICAVSTIPAPAPDQLKQRSSLA
jgi:hypothetical protein